MTLEHAPSQPALPHFLKLSPTTSSTFSVDPAALKAQRSTLNTSRKRTRGTATKTINVVNNFICFLFAATAFAMIGIEASGHHGSTHSGTQQVQQ
jgi:hypothetical protein